jgi:hypothetical protein
LVFPFLYNTVVVVWYFPFAISRLGQVCGFILFYFFLLTLSFEYV